MNPNTRKPVKGRCPACGRTLYYGGRSYCAQHATELTRIVRTLNKYQGKRRPSIPATRPQQPIVTRCIRFLVAVLFNVVAALAYLSILRANLWQPLPLWQKDLLFFSAWFLQGAIFYWSFAPERGYRS